MRSVNVARHSLPSEAKFRAIWICGNQELIAEFDELCDMMDQVRITPEGKFRFIFTNGYEIEKESCRFIMNLRYVYECLCRGMRFFIVMFAIYYFIVSNLYGSKNCVHSTERVENIGFLLYYNMQGQGPKYVPHANRRTVNLETENTL